MTSVNAIVAAAKTAPKPTITAYSSGNWFQFEARNDPSESRRFAANRKEKSIDARPSRRRIVPWMNPSTNMPNRNRTTIRSNLSMLARISPMFTSAPQRRRADPSGWTRERHRVAARIPAPQPDSGPDPTADICRNSSRDGLDREVDVALGEWLIAGWERQPEREALLAGVERGASIDVEQDDRLEA